MCNPFSRMKIHGWGVDNHHTKPSWKGLKGHYQTLRGKNEGWCLYDTYLVPSSRTVQSSHMYVKKNGCVPSPKERNGRKSSSFPSIVVMRAWEEEETSFKRTRKKESGKSFKGREKNQALVHWKEEGKALSLLQKEIKAQAIREVKKRRKK